MQMPSDYDSIDIESLKYETLYYEFVEHGNRYYGRVYHLDEDGEDEITVFQSAKVDSEAEALDACYDWLLANGLEADVL